MQDDYESLKTILFLEFMFEKVKLVQKFKEVLISLDLPHPFGLALYGDSIYWTDWTEHTIQSANKVTGKDRKIILQGREILLDVHVFHRQRLTG
ncbi:low-density lipoprotein receptor-related protein 4 [Trichonephila inaurata madagascariensis]|uniref:Low-density lipoprotein receptor-related protein 4 n=1 Tax=Trichonephila inaurata madagascariensis TaxID=2747483 RepID=A0A8X6Y0S6_9ARAC|nr:low-density lipoprotein receptor-related protein 4 [Trichonephila inaurata madagascariensis]